MTPGQERLKKSVQRNKARREANKSKKEARRSGDYAKAEQIKKEYKKESKRIVHDRSPKSSEQRKAEVQSFSNRLGGMSRRTSLGAQEFQRRASVQPLPAATFRAPTTQEQDQRGFLQKLSDKLKTKQKEETTKPFMQRLTEGAARAGDPTGALRGALTGVIGAGMKARTEVPAMYKNITAPGPKITYPLFQEALKETTDPIIQPIRESGAAFGDVALRTSPIEGARNLFAGAKSAYQGKGFERGVIEDQARQLIYEKVAGVDVTKPGEGKKFIGRAMEAPTYLYSGLKGSLGENVLTRMFNRTKAVLPESVILTGIQALEEGKDLRDTVASIPSNLVQNTAAMALFTNFFGELSHYKKTHGKLPIGLSIEDVSGGKKSRTMKTSDLVSHEGAPDKKAVLEWKNKIESGEKIEPLKVIKEGEKFGVEDGKHRLQAYQELGITDVPVEVVKPRKIKATPKSGINLSKADEFFAKSPESLPGEYQLPAGKKSTLLSRPKIDDVSVPYTKSEAQIENKVNQILKKGEAKRQFKKTGVAPEFVNVQKPSKKIMVAGEGGVVQSTERQISGAMNKVERGTFLKRLGDKFKDISPTAKGFKDATRNFERFFGDNYQTVKKTILDPFEDSKSKMFDNLKSISDELNEKIVKKMGFGKGSKKSADLQKFGEGLISKEEVVKKYGKDSLGDFMHANNWFRKQYDRLLDEVNATRARIYPNDPTKIIPKRKDYYRHFQEMQEGIGGLINVFETPAGITPSLAGASQFTKPKSKWLSFAQKRLGGKTEYDATGGFLNYIRSAEYAKNVDPHINEFRNLGTFIQESSQKTGKDYNNMIEFLEDFAGDLSGKTNPLDRGIQKYIPGGRKAFKAIDWVNKRVKANVILGNASSSLAQIFNVPQGIASAGEGNFLKGLGRLATDIFRESPEMAKSSFIKERYFKALDKFDVGILKSTKKFAAWMVTALDELGTKSIWNAHYEKAIAENIAEPIRYADDLTRKMVAGRGIGEVPLAQKSKVFQMIAPFQLEVANQWHVLGDLAKSKNGSVKVMKMFAYSYLFNRVAKEIRGSDVSFDPINAIVEGVQTYQGEEDKKMGLLKAGGRLAGEVLSNVPGGQTAAAMYPEFGFKVGDKQFPTRKDLMGEGDPTRFGGGLLIARGAQDPLYKLLPGFGGQQIKRTKEGIESVMRGYAETPKGEVRFPIDKNAKNAAKAGLFGVYATEQGKEYSENETRPLSEKQSEQYLKGEKGYQEILDKREKDRVHQEQLDKIKKEVEETGKTQTIGDTTVFMEDGEVKTTQSKTILEAKQKYEEYKNLSDEEFMLKREELSKIGDKKTQIAKQIGELRRNETTKQMGLEFEGEWSNLANQDKANVIMKKMEGISDEDKSRFYEELISRDVASDDLKKEVGRQVYDKLNQTSLEAKYEDSQRFGGALHSQLVKDMFLEINAIKQGGDEERAGQLVDMLTDEDYKVYEGARQTWRGGNTTQLREYLKLDPAKAVEYLRSQGKPEQDRLLEVMTADEYKLYEEGKRTIESQKTSFEDLNNEYNQGLAEIDSRMNSLQGQVAMADENQITIGKGAAVKNLNPLNVKIGGATKHWIDEGLAEPGSMGADGGQFIKFNDAETGLKAAEELLFGPVYADKTVDAALRKWSNQGYGAEITSIEPNKIMSDLTGEEKRSVVLDMAERESDTTIGPERQVGETQYASAPSSQQTIASIATPKETKKDSKSEVESSAYLTMLMEYLNKKPLPPSKMSKFLYASGSKPLYRPETA